MDRGCNRPYSQPYPRGGKVRDFFTDCGTWGIMEGDCNSSNTVQGKQEKPKFITVSKYGRRMGTGVYIYKVESEMVYKALCDMPDISKGVVKKEKDFVVLLKGYKKLKELIVNYKIKFEYSIIIPHSKNIVESEIVGVLSGLEMRTTITPSELSTTEMFFKINNEEYLLQNMKNIILFKEDYRATIECKDNDLYLNGVLVKFSDFQSFIFNYS